MDMETLGSLFFLEEENPMCVREALIFWRRLISLLDSFFAFYFLETQMDGRRWWGSLYLVLVQTLALRGMNRNKIRSFQSGGAMGQVHPCKLQARILFLHEAPKLKKESMAQSKQRLPKIKLTCHLRSFACITPFWPSMKKGVESESQLL